MSESNFWVEYFRWVGFVVAVGVSAAAVLTTIFAGAVALVIAVGSV